MTSPARTGSRARWTVAGRPRGPGGRGRRLRRPRRRGPSPARDLPATTDRPPRSPRPAPGSRGSGRSRSGSTTTSPTRSPPAAGPSATRGPSADGSRRRRVGSRNVLTMDDLGRPDQARPPSRSRTCSRRGPTSTGPSATGSRPGPARRRGRGLLRRPGDRPAPPGDAAPAGHQRHYLLPIDARPASWDETGWRLDEAIDRWRRREGTRSSAGSTRRSTAAGSGSTASRFEPSATPFLQQLVRWPGVTAWLAADGRPAAEAAAVGEHSPFTAALLEALGTPQRPDNLLACLNAMTREPALAAQGFRTLGGIAPDLNLWSASLRQETPRSASCSSSAGMRRGRGDRLQCRRQPDDHRRAGLDGQGLAGGRPDAPPLADVSHGRRDGTGPEPRRPPAGQRRRRGLAPDLGPGQAAGSPRRPPHDRGVDRVAFLPDGGHFVSLDLDGKSWLWSTADAGPRSCPFRSIAPGRARRGPGPFAFALAEADGKIMLLGPDGALRKTLDGPGGTVTSRRLATDGRVLAAGDDRGRAIVWDTATGKEVLPAPVRGADRRPQPLRLEGARGRGGPEIHLVPLEPKATRRTSPRRPAGGEPVRVLERRPVAGRLHPGGDFQLWRVGDPGAARPSRSKTPRRRDGPRPSPSRPTGAGSSRAIRMAASGPGTCPRRPAPPIPPRRGQVAGLSVSGDGRYLLQVSQDWQAQVWDLQDGRGLTTIEGTWTAGVLTPDGEASS